MSPNTPNTDCKDDGDDGDGYYRVMVVVDVHWFDGVGDGRSHDGDDNGGSLCLHGWIR